MVFKQHSLSSFRCPYFLPFSGWVLFTHDSGTGRACRAEVLHLVGGLYKVAQLGAQRIHDLLYLRR
jgi:hypothetical protein